MNRKQNDADGQSFSPINYSCFDCFVCERGSLFVSKADLEYSMCFQSIVCLCLQENQLLFKIVKGF